MLLAILPACGSRAHTRKKLQSRHFNQKAWTPDDYYTETKKHLKNFFHLTNNTSF